MVDDENVRIAWQRDEAPSGTRGTMLRLLFLEGWEQLHDHDYHDNNYHDNMHNAHQYKESRFWRFVLMMHTMIISVMKFKIYISDHYPQIYKCACMYTQTNVILMFAGEETKAKTGRICNESWGWNIIPFLVIIFITTNIGLMTTMMMTMTTIQVHDDLGQLDCAKSPTTLSREGAAAGFFQPEDLSGIWREFVW